jgi:hypothetical protein
MARPGRRVPLCHRRELTLDSALPNGRWIRDICGALTVPIILQYLDAKQCLDQIQLQAKEPDRFVWCWTMSGQYNSKSAYEAITTRNTVIGCVLSEAVHLKPLLDHISTVVQDLNHY